jgi:hypothetical protein
MTEIDKNENPVGMPLVAKSSLYVEDKNKDVNEFHKRFIRTQLKANNYAEKFNVRLDRLAISKSIPRITFLNCDVYRCQYYDNGKYIEKAYLQEKKLNPINYKKWNNNTGKVDGIQIINKFETEASLKPVTNLDLRNDKIEEGDENESESDDDNDNIVNSQKTTEAIDLENSILPCDIPQAFTHFTFSHTKGKTMVCDIQGELILKLGEPVFECTDPCIHYRPNNQRGKNYGKTDFGSKGMSAFFDSHQCSSLCKLLRIANKSYTNK